jgi:hypothetical protein
VRSRANQLRAVLGFGSRQWIGNIAFDYSDAEPLPDRDQSRWNALLDEWQQRLGREIREGEVYARPAEKLD